jgi:hypothetical protein
MARSLLPKNVRISAIWYTLEPFEPRKPPTRLYNLLIAMSFVNYRWFVNDREAIQHVLPYLFSLESEADTRKPYTLALQIWSSFGIGHQKVLE